MKTSFSEKIARLLAAWRWPLLLVGVLLCACCFLPARCLDFDRSIEHMFAPDDPLLPPYRRLKDTFGGNEIVMVVYADPRLLQADRSGIRRLAEASGQLKQTPGVRDVFSLAELDDALGKISAAAGLFRLTDDPARSVVDPDSQTARRFLDLFEGYTHGHDGNTAAVLCMLEPGERTDVPRRETIDGLRAKAQRLPDGQIAGEAVMVADGFRYIEQDARRLGWVSMVLMGLTIIVCFRSLRWMLIAVGVVQMALLATKAILFWSRLQLSMVSSMLAAIVTVVGVATVVHVIVRFRTGRAEGRSPRDSLIGAAVLLAAPVFWACTTDAVGFASLMVARVGPVQDFGLMMAIGCLMVLLSVTLLAPALSVVGWHPSAAGPLWGERLLDSQLGHALRWVQRRPRTIGGLALLICAAAAAGAFRLEVETDFTKNFRSGSPIVRAYETIETKLGGAGVWDIVVPASESLSWEYLERIRRLQRRLRTEVTVIGKDGTTRPALNVLSLDDAILAGAPKLKDMPRGVLRDMALKASILSIRSHLPVFTASLYSKSADRSERFYYRIMLRAAERQPARQKRRLIEQVTAIAREEFDGAEVTGYFVLLTNLIDSVIRDQWLAFGVAMAGIGATMLVAFRRLSYAVIALIPNSLPILTVTGLMGWLDLKINMGAAMIAAVSVGLSVDSSIHYISFFRRALAEGKTVTEALAAVQQSVGRAMVFSTLALVAGFAVLCTSQFVPTVYFGSLVALSMLGGLLGNLLILPLLLRLGDETISRVANR